MSTKPNYIKNRKCEICHHKFKKIYELMRHYREVHSLVPPSHSTQWGEKYTQIANASKNIVRNKNALKDILSMDMKSNPFYKS